MRTLTTLALLGLLGACGSSEIQAVEQVDLERYAGTWYDIASFPQTFQEGCSCTSATYTLRDNNEIGVLNRCLKGGTYDEATARAFLPDPDRPGELKVEFFWPFAADYWIIDLGVPDSGDYTHAVVSEPGQQYLWILSRSREMNSTTYAELTTWLEEQGFDMSRLNRVDQSDCPAE